MKFLIPQLVYFLSDHQAYKYLRSFTEYQLLVLGVVVVTQAVDQLIGDGPAARR